MPGKAHGMATAPIIYGHMPEVMVMVRSPKLASSQVVKDVVLGNRQSQS